MESDTTFVILNYFCRVILFNYDFFKSGFFEV